MSNDTQLTETEELRARIDRLEYQLQVVSLQDFDMVRTPGGGGPGKEAGEFSALVGEKTPLAEVHSNDDYPEHHSEPWFAGCACGWTVYTDTESEAQALVGPHLRDAHPEFVTHWPELAGAVV